MINNKPDYKIAKPIDLVATPKPGKLRNVR